MSSCYPTRLRFKGEVRMAFKTIWTCLFYSYLSGFKNYPWWNKLFYIDLIGRLTLVKVVDICAFMLHTRVFDFFKLDPVVNNLFFRKSDDIIFVKIFQILFNNIINYK